MKKKLIAKLDEHIERLLEKPELTNEEYRILKERLADIRFEEMEDARRKDWEEKYKPMMEMVFSANTGGGFCAR